MSTGRMSSADVVWAGYGRFANDPAAASAELGALAATVFAFRCCGCGAERSATFERLSLAAVGAHCDGVELVVLACSSECPPTRGGG